MAKGANTWAILAIKANVRARMVLETTILASLAITTGWRFSLKTWSGLKYVHKYCGESWAHLFLPQPQCIMLNWCSVSNLFCWSRSASPAEYKNAPILHLDPKDNLGPTKVQLSLPFSPWADTNKQEMVLKWKMAAFYPNMIFLLKRKGLFKK